MINYGKLFREIRLKRGFGIRELSRKTGISHVEIINIENGKRVNVRINTWEKLLKSLDISYEDFILLAVANSKIPK